MNLSTKSVVNKVCIVIPVYKAFKALSEKEIISLKQVFKILYKYNMIFIGKDEIVSQYLSFSKSEFPDLKIKTVKFAPSSFGSVSTYNSLLISKKFYDQFSAYLYMLIYQLDAYVFKDELEAWCNKKYDYIGAPWFEGWGNSVSHNIIGSGNGGFSLRNINSSIRILKRIKTIKKIKNATTKFDSQNRSYFIMILKTFNRFFKIGEFSLLHEIFLKNINEDVYWVNVLGRIFNDFKVAPPEVALNFSFEVNPSLLFDLTKNSLPFGCHAWEKHEPEFWIDHIKG